MSSLWSIKRTQASLPAEQFPPTGTKPNKKFIVGDIFQRPE